MDLMAYGPYDGLPIYPIDPYDGPIPYQWPALLSSPPVLLWILNDGLPLPYGSYYGVPLPYGSYGLWIL